MANNSSHRLAERLVGKWLSANPTDSVNIGDFHIDDELQSLSWLLNLPCTENKPSRVDTSKPVLQSVNVQPIATNTYIGVERTRYSKSSLVKPAYSYAKLITMAIEESPEKKISLSSLYKWITDHFPYYRKTDTHWKNSVRHNLSVSKRFEKVPRRPHESGKGGFWRIKSSSTNSISAKRKDNDNILQAVKRARLENMSSNRSPDTGNVNTGTDPFMDGVIIKTENESDKYEDYQHTRQSTPSSSDIKDSLSRSSSPSYTDATYEDLSCFEDLLLFDYNEKIEKITTTADPLCLPVSEEGFRNHDSWLELSNSCESLPTSSNYNNITAPFNEDLNISDLFSTAIEFLM